MGEWSDYFVDYPEENPATYVGGKFDPQGAAQRNRQAQDQRDAQATLDAEIAAIIKKHRPQSAGK